MTKMRSFLRPRNATILQNRRSLHYTKHSQNRREEIKMFKRGITVLLLAALMFAVYGTVGSGQSLYAATNVKGSGDVVKEDRKIGHITGVRLATSGKMFIKLGNKESLTIEAEDNLLEYIETEVKNGVLEIDNRRKFNLRPTEPIYYYLTVKELNQIGISSSGDIEAPFIKADKFEISISSSGDLDMEGLDAPTVEIGVSSSGDVTIEDLNTRELDIGISSSGDVSFNKVDAAEVSIGISSSGDVIMKSLFAENIESRISSSGNIEIGSGKVNSQRVRISSSGDYIAGKLESLEADVRTSSSGDILVWVNDYLKASTSSSGSITYIGKPEVDMHTSSSGKIRRKGI
jgi:hypothetical protein